MFTVEAWFASTSRQLAQLRFADGRVWTAADVQALLGQPRGTEGADHLIGSAGNDRLAGFGGNDRLEGLAGDDWLDGGTDADTMIGGAGDDQYVVDAAGDVVSESASAGRDTVWSSVSFTLSANVEVLRLTGDSALDATGNGLDNELIGNAASNRLNGGAGADRMAGGAGDDVYVVGSAGDIVIEQRDEGHDRVDSSISWTLGDHVEDLRLTGSAATDGVGNALDNVLQGNGAANRLVGGAGDDRLDGRGGNDTMLGGAGDDTYVVNASGDLTSELEGEGEDTVEASISWTLSQHVERLVLTGSRALSGTGNAADNHLAGNVAANRLTGGAGQDVLDGGAGADTLTGGAGADTYRLARGGGVDTIVENDATAGVVDRIEFADIDSQAVRWTRSGNDLLVRTLDDLDGARLKDWYLGASRHVERIAFADGVVIGDQQVASLVQAMAGFGATTSVSAERALMLGAAPPVMGVTLQAPQAFMA